VALPSGAAITALELLATRVASAFGWPPWWRRPRLATRDHWRGDRLLL